MQLKDIAGNVIFDTNINDLEELHPTIKLSNESRIFVERHKLSIERDNELKGFVIDNIFMNEDTLKTMAVQYNIAEANEVIEWIDINNQTVTFSKTDFGALIKAGSQKVKEIYFNYRALKDAVRSISV